MQSGRLPYEKPPHFYTVIREKEPTRGDCPGGVFFHEAAPQAGKL